MRLFLIVLSELNVLIFFPLWLNLEITAVDMWASIGAGRNVNDLKKGEDFVYIYKVNDNMYR